MASNESVDRVRLVGCFSRATWQIGLSVGLVVFGVTGGGILCGGAWPWFGSTLFNP